MFVVLYPVAMTGCNGCESAMCRLRRQVDAQPELLAEESFRRIFFKAMRKDLFYEDASFASSWTPLHLACAIGSVAAMRHFLENGADLLAPAVITSITDGSVNTCHGKYTPWRLAVRPLRHCSTCKDCIALVFECSKYGVIKTEDACFLIETTTKFNIGGFMNFLFKMLEAGSVSLLGVDSDDEDNRSILTCLVEEEILDWSIIDKLTAYLPTHLETKNELLQWTRVLMWFPRMYPEEEWHSLQKLQVLVGARPHWSLDHNQIQIGIADFMYDAEETAEDRDETLFKHALKFWTTVLQCGIVKDAPLIAPIFRQGLETIREHDLANDWDPPFDVEGGDTCKRILDLLEHPPPLPTRLPWLPQGAIDDFDYSEECAWGQQACKLAHLVRGLEFKLGTLPHAFLTPLKRAVLNIWPDVKPLGGPSIPRSVYPLNDDGSNMIVLDQNGGAHHMPSSAVARSTLLSNLCRDIVDHGAVPTPLSAEQLAAFAAFNVESKPTELSDEENTFLTTWADTTTRMNSLIHAAVYLQSDVLMELLALKAALEICEDRDWRF